MGERGKEGQRVTEGAKEGEKGRRGAEEKGWGETPVRGWEFVYVVLLLDAMTHNANKSSKPRHAHRIRASHSRSHVRTPIHTNTHTCIVD